MRRAGVTVGLGCDGSAAHDASDLWGEVRQALLLAHLKDGPSALTARDVLAMATAGGAGCLGRTDIGSLEVGKCADLACYPLTGLSTAGAVLDPVEAIVRCAVRQASHTVVNGRVLVRDGRLTTPTSRTASSGTGRWRGAGRAPNARQSLALTGQGTARLV